MEKMKTNKAMRTAFVMLIAVLLSLCGVGGTFAKYTTATAAQDNARVAKFGVTATASGSLFATTYVQANDDGTGNTPGTGSVTLTVESKAYTAADNTSKTDNVVAPGTQNNEGITIALAGETETAVKVEFAVTDPNKESSTAASDVFLKKGTYTDYTVNPTKTFSFITDNDVDYHPIVYTLKRTQSLTDEEKATQSTSTTESTSATQQTGTFNDNTTYTFTEETTSDSKVTTYTGTLATIEKVLEEVVSNNSIATNKDLNSTDGIGTLNLTWEWPFDTENKGENDAKDTLLGKLAADSTIKAKAGTEGSDNTALTLGDDYNLNPSIKIDVTITQVD